MSYTMQDYEQDLKISQWTVNKYFRSIPEYRDDLMQESLIALYKARQKIDYSQHGYTVYLFKTSKHAMCVFLRKEMKLTNKYTNVSIYAINDKDTMLIDLLSDVNDIAVQESQQNYESMIEQIKTIFAKNKKINHKKGNFKKIITLYFLENKKQTEIVKILNISRQRIQEVIQQTREILTKELKVKN